MFQRSAAVLQGGLPPRAKAVLEYWFGAGTVDSTAVVKPNFELWFGGTPEIDAYITTNFGNDVSDAANDKLQDWLSEKYSSLALIVLLDQCALNIYRDKPQSFQTSAKAIPHAYHFVAQGWDKELPELMRAFVYLPLEHSEDLRDQEKGVEFFENSVRWEQEAGRSVETAEMSLHYAKLHRDVVQKYGRFPGRNAVFGRTSTPEEEQYLKDGGVF